MHDNHPDNTRPSDQMSTTRHPRRQARAVIATSGAFLAVGLLAAACGSAATKSATATPASSATTAAPVAGTGVQSTLLSTIHTAAGQTEVTYDHWPLYTFAEDSGPGQAKGEGIDGTWFAISAAGAEVKAASPAPAKAESATTVPSGVGY